MIPSLRRFVFFGAGAVPFLLVPIGTAWSVGPLARMGAHWCHVLGDFSGGTVGDQVAATSKAPLAVATPVPSAEEGTVPPSEPHMNEAHTPSPGSRAHSDRPSVAAFGLTAAWRGATARRTRPSVFVGPDSIQRAIPSESRPTSSWTNRTAEHPAGLLIQSPGALSGVIEAGDILVEAEGQALGSFEQLLVTVKEAYERRAKRLSGRLFRRGDLLPVTVEPGW